MNSPKITKRDRYNSIIALCDFIGPQADEFDLDGIVEFCNKEIALLDNRAEKNREKAAEKREAGDALQDAVLSVLTDELATRVEITERVNDPEATVAKVGYRLSALTKAGKAVKEDVVVVGEDGKNKKMAAYRLA
jgi:hypothetical protein